MATILTSSQQTFVDITDQRKLSAYITSNLPKTQSEDPNTLPHEYAPSWATTNLVLTPVIFLDQTNISLTATGVTLTAASAKQNKNIAALEDDILGQTSKIESISGKVDTINSQKMYHTERVVDGVSIFKDKGQKSRMHCKVFSWDKDITDSLESESFIWHRKSSDEAADAEWDKAHRGIKTIIITTEDVQDNASFYCEIIL